MAALAEVTRKGKSDSELGKIPEWGCSACPGGTGGRKMENRGRRERKTLVVGYTLHSEGREKRGLG